MKLEQSRQVFCHVDPIVTPGVEVKLVGNVTRVKRFVQSYGTGVETKIVFGAAIKVDLQSGETRRARDGQGVVVFPEDGVERRTKDVTENPRPGKLARIAGCDCGNFLKQGRAVGAKGNEELRMKEGQMQRAVSAHGNSGYAVRGAPGPGAIAFFDLRQKFSEKEILITTVAVAGIYVEAGTPIRCDD